MEFDVQDKRWVLGEVVQVIRVLGVRVIVLLSVVNFCFSVRCQFLVFSLSYFLRFVKYLNSLVVRRLVFLCFFTCYGSLVVMLVIKQQLVRRQWQCSRIRNSQCCRDEQESQDQVYDCYEFLFVLGFWVMVGFLYLCFFMFRIRKYNCVKIFYVLKNSKFFLLFY